MTGRMRDPGPMAVAEDPSEQERPLVERCGFSPLSLVAELPGLVPRAIERGRGQMKLAQAVGRFAIEHSPLGSLPSLQAAVEAPEAASAPSEPATADTSHEAATPPAALPAEEPLGPAIPVARLALPDYDSLSASQVIPRLQGLNPSELEDLRRYEAAGRSRRTILSKIAQIQSSS